MPLEPQNAAQTAEQREQDNVLDRREITPAMKSAVKTEIDSINDPSTKQALANIYHILTGEEISTGG